MTALTRLQALSSRETALSLTHLFLGLALFLVLWRIPYYGKFVLDDPFITFRYGQHLAQQGQFTFNLDTYVLATTTPVYGLIATLFEWLRLPTPQVAMIVNLGFEIALLYVLGLILSEFRLPPSQMRLAYGIVGVLTITNRAMSIASNSGMETPLFTLLNMLTILFILRQQYMKGALVGSLATLTRPDGIFVLLLLGLAVMVRQRRLPLLEMGLSVLIAAPWLVVATLTYGSPIPQSVVAKDSIARMWNPNLLANNLRVIFYEPLRFFGLFALPPLLWAGYQATQLVWRMVSGMLLVFAATHLIYATLPNNLGFDWYFAPLFTTLNLIVAVGLAQLLTETGWKKWLARICTLGIAAGVIYSSAGNFLSVAEIDSIWHEGMLRVIEYLNTNAAEGSVVQSTNIGVLGYATNFAILDPLGLASPEITDLIPSATSLDHLTKRVAEVFRPDYIVSFGPSDYAGYESAAEFPTFTLPLIIYQRISE